MWQNYMTPNHKNSDWQHPVQSCAIQIDLLIPKPNRHHPQTNTILDTIPRYGRAGGRRTTTSERARSGRGRIVGARPVRAGDEAFEALDKRQRCQTGSPSGWR